VSLGSGKEKNFIKYFRLKQVEILKNPQSQKLEHQNFLILFLLTLIKIKAFMGGQTSLNIKKL